MLQIKVSSLFFRKAKVLTNNRAEKVDNCLPNGDYIQFKFLLFSSFLSIEVVAKCCAIDLSCREVSIKQRQPCLIPRPCPAFYRLQNRKVGESIFSHVSDVGIERIVEWVKL